eukprot:349493-Prymnesium_polylepis.1
MRVRVNTNSRPSLAYPPNIKGRNRVCSRTQHQMGCEGPSACALSDRCPPSAAAGGATAGAGGRRGT